jgi:hypothetical protein
MPLYFFNLEQSSSIISDPEGMELPDEAAAREHAAVVARELMQNNEQRTRTWRLRVCNARREVQFELPFAAVEDAFAHLLPDIHISIGNAC